VFAATGAVYALVFVLVNARIAAGARWPSAPLWVASAALVVAVEWVVPATLPAIMWCALGTAVLAVAATAVVNLRSTPMRPAGERTSLERSTPPTVGERT
jgi:hypothetical protein